MKRALFLAILAAFALMISSMAVMANDGRIHIGDDDEGDHVGDAVITEEEARTIAEEHMQATAFAAELNNEDGYLVWGVHVENDDGKWDVKIDAGDGSVLKAESDNDDD